MEIQSALWKACHRFLRYTSKDTDGSDGPITVHDQFTHTPAGSRVIYDENNIVIYKRAFDVDGKPISITMTGYTVKYTQQDGTGGGEAGSFTITGLPALGENEAYCCCGREGTPPGAAAVRRALHEKNCYEE